MADSRAGAEEVQEEAGTSRSRKEGDVEGHRPSGGAASLKQRPLAESGAVELPENNDHKVYSY